VFVINRGEAIPDLMIFVTGETNLHGIGLHGPNIIQRRESALTNGPATFLIRLDNDGPANETFIVRANVPPPGWDARFFRDTTNLTSAITGGGWTVSLPAAGNVVLGLEVTSITAALGESRAEWVVTAGGTRTNSGLDAVRAVVTRAPSPPSLEVVSRAGDVHLGSNVNLFNQDLLFTSI